ncbi:MAG: LysM peptidoglycan-binding domain-containing protein [Streptosporangiaceae bacterium]|nr:LysM peptidoglycan-binding domain-containing protein [Streptosporangiaceae bacterium]
MEKVAEKAGKAAPAMAIAGALVAAPHAHAAGRVPARAAAAPAKVPARAAAVPGRVPARAAAAAGRVPVRGAAAAGRARTDALVGRAQPGIRRYTVVPGDTLSGIAQRFYGNATDWPWLYHVNQSVVADPNLIYVGERLQVPHDPPADAASYAPKHAKTDALTSSVSSSGSSGSSGSFSSSGSAGASSFSGSSGSSSLSGTLSCSGLEALWEQAGGSPGAAFMAAEIAMAESGGQQDALSPSDDYGYWQINASHGPLATFDALGNARAAVAISDNGTNWTPWTTYVTGAYQGRC